MRVGEEFFNSLVVLAKLRAVAFVENKHHALGAERFKSILVIFPVAATQSQTKLLDGRHDNLVAVIIRQQATHQGFGVGVFLDTPFLKAVEFLPRLAIQILAIHHEQTFFNVRVIFEQGGRLERGVRVPLPVVCQT